jgi:DNA-binding NarL/FixJ family response regulator
MRDKVKSLTTKQLEVLALYAAGYTGPEISKKLFLSGHTVRNRIRYAIKKTGAKSITQLVAWCVTEKVILVLDEENIVYRTGK